VHSFGRQIYGFLRVAKAARQKLGVEGECRVGRSISDFRVDGAPDSFGLPASEAKLLASCMKGELCILGTTTPDHKTEINNIRPEFLRFLALGGDAEFSVHEKGVRLQGAFIRGDIDLENTRSNLAINLTNCRVDGRIFAQNARFLEFAFDQSCCKGLIAEDARFEGSVSLRKSSIEGETRFTGAKIGGDLDCSGATLKNTNGDALACRRSEIQRSVFLSDHFAALGRVRFSGAHIRGDFACHGGSFESHAVEPSDYPKGSQRASDAITLVNATIDGVLWLGPWTPPHDVQVKIRAR
jgi:hypothetical protein